MKRLWALFRLWNLNYCFEHKEFSCVRCYCERNAKLLKNAGL